MNQLTDGFLGPPIPSALSLSKVHLLKVSVYNIARAPGLHNDVFSKLKSVLSPDNLCIIVSSVSQSVPLGIAFGNKINIFFSLKNHYR